MTTLKMLSLCKLPLLAWLTAQWCAYLLCLAIFLELQNKYTIEQFAPAPAVEQKLFAKTEFQTLDEKSMVIERLFVQK